MFRSPYCIFQDTIFQGTIISRYTYNNESTRSSCSYEGTFISGSSYVYSTCTNSYNSYFRKYLQYSYESTKVRKYFRKYESTFVPSKVVYLSIYLAM